MQASRRTAEQEYGLKPLSELGSGTAHAPEKKLLSEIIEALNEIFGADVRSKKTTDPQLGKLTLHKNHGTNPAGESD